MRAPEPGALEDERELAHLGEHRIEYAGHQWRRVNESTDGNDGRIPPIAYDEVLYRHRPPRRDDDLTHYAMLYYRSVPELGRDLWLSPYFAGAASIYGIFLLRQYEPPMHSEPVPSVAQIFGILKNDNFRRASLFLFLWIPQSARNAWESAIPGWAPEAFQKQILMTNFQYYLDRFEGIYEQVLGRDRSSRCVGA